MTLIDPPQPSTATTAALDFPDNRLLIDLCGPFNSNLTQIESHLGVDIAHQGNRLVINGEAAAEAAGVLEGAYARLEAGKTAEAADIDALIRMNTQPAVPTDQIEMFAPGALEIRTRKKTVEPRTDAQKGYTQALLDNELTFGIGPCGDR